MIGESADAKTVMPDGGETTGPNVQPSVQSQEATLLRAELPKKLSRKQKKIDKYTYVPSQHNRFIVHDQ